MVVEVEHTHNDNDA